MIMTDDRLREIVGIVKPVVQQHIKVLPVDIHALCRTYGARMTSVEDAVVLGLDRGTILACMGSRDGVAMRGRKVWGIIYDKNAPVNRLRFTLAEEFCHTLLGHTLDSRFNAVCPTYDDSVYERYEEEAKVAADLLLICPSVYYRYRRRKSIGELARLFSVSEACMWTAGRLYDEKEDVVRSAWGAWLPLDVGVGRYEDGPVKVRPVRVEHLSVKKERGRHFSN